ncbi:OLC1v1030897C1 [Oldenlandia corymbosa var. corymbosa]|uniref:OLC1v1030897C1 n=1 Tax=Oldenlandia corymbosa var. corymbosa TaxID=529605 RepID=A0AAV1CHX3_OLDCO|nr:OLC1v1030897C1 [Oldenlandia corymbosa var. corymbosa]
MNSGPSPLIPLLLVGTLSFLLHGRSFLEDISFVSDAEDSAFTLLLVIPIVVLLVVHQVTQSLVLPLAIVLVAYTVSKMFLGPLLLIAIIYVLSVWVPSFEFFNGRGGVHQGNYSSDEHGWGCALLFAVFLALRFIFADGCGQWGLVLVAVLFFLLYNFQSSPY